MNALQSIKVDQFPQKAEQLLQNVVSPNQIDEKCNGIGIPAILANYHLATPVNLDYDLCQEIIVNILESVGNFKGNANINTWIYRIAINVSISFCKKYCYTQTIEYWDFLSVFENNRFDLDIDIVLEQLYFVINQLENNDKKIMFLYINQYSHREIANRMGISITNVGTRINRIVAKLKK